MKQLMSHPDAPAFLLMAVCMGELMGAQADASVANPKDLTKRGRLPLRGWMNTCQAQVC